MFNPHLTLNCAGRLVSLQEPIVMGILNVTPDSFYDGGHYDSDKKILTQVEKMLSEGAKIIDVGAQSSRPGADKLSAKIEQERLLPVIQKIVKSFPDAILSVDTFRSEVARQSVEHGAAIINDISGGSLDKDMYKTVAALKNIPYILMHMKGNPQNMQDAPTYNNVALELLDYFIESDTICLSYGFTSPRDVSEFCFAYDFFKC